ncbi:MAG: radical SAM family heme chaperone HemW [Salibacteraceae bacterium]|nr:radical SAM family heme chaperone HemW [Salibacteraceae bacterium]
MRLSSRYFKFEVEGWKFKDECDDLGYRSVLLDISKQSSLQKIQNQALAGIYIHIPFCKQACSYCDFHFSTNQSMRKKLVNAICIEMKLRKAETNEPIASIYFGGGSPSILSDDEMQQIFNALHANFDLSQVQEITLETNPDDHSLQQLQFWKSLGVNRLSIGIQSFIDRDLILMNRAHSAQHAELCVQQAREAGFESLTIDLIYGVPNQSFEEWQSNVHKAIALNTDHVSAYCLTVEEKTALHHQVKKGIITDKSDEEIEQEYLFLHHAFAKAGLAHYEISNYAREGKTAFHNSSYWSGKIYLGFGPSAHSFDGKNTRRWNIAHNIKYAQAIASDKRYFETETLNANDKLNEQLMTSLRTAVGFKHFALDAETQKLVLDQLNAMPQHLKDCVWKNDTHFGIHPENWLLADAIIREVMV